jgi:hypothetical protein
VLVICKKFHNTFLIKLMKTSSPVTDLLLWKRFDRSLPIAKRTKPTTVFVKWCGVTVLVVLVLTLMLAWHLQQGTRPTELPLQAMQRSAGAMTQVGTAATVLPEPLPE